MLPVDKNLYTNNALVHLMVPLFLEQLLFILVGTADTFMIANLGEMSVSGVSLVDAINVIAAVFFAALGTGGSVVTAQFLGAKQPQRARESARQLLYVSLLVSVVIVPFVYIFRNSIFSLSYGALPQGVTEQAMVYFRITVFTYPLMSLYMAYAALFRAMNCSSVSMRASFYMNILNVIGNYLLLYVFRLGVAGAAYSTLFSRFVALLFLGISITRKERPIWLDYNEKILLDLKYIRQILFIGIPSGIENTLFHFGRLITTKIITTFGIAQITANAISNNMAGLSCMIGNAFCLGMITVIGQSVGSGSEQTVRYYIKHMMKTAYAFGAFWNLLMLAAIPLIPKCFSSLSQESLDYIIVLVTIYYIAAMVLWPVSFIFPNALRSANDVKFVMTVSVLSMLFIRVGFAVILARVLQMGVHGVWMAMYMDWIARIIFFTWRWRSNRWLKNVSLH